MSVVRVKLIAKNSRVGMPALQSADAAGFDLQADVPEGGLRLDPGERKLVPTGIAIALERGYEGQVRPRSGLALKHGVTVLNAPGTIDADYRGEVGVVLINHSGLPYTVRPGERIAQLVIAPVQCSVLEQVADLEATERGAGGFGSTGQREKEPTS